MTDLTPVETTDFSHAGSTEIPWSRVRDLLSAPSPPDQPGGYFPSYLCTARPSGRPHATGIGIRWYDGDIYFLSASDSRKSRNLETNPSCSIAMNLPGDLDLVLEGEAGVVDDRAMLEAVGNLVRQSGWPVELTDEGFTAPFGPSGSETPPWQLYRFVFHTAIGQGYDGATRWRFDR